MVKHACAGLAALALTLLVGCGGDSAPPAKSGGSSGGGGGGEPKKTTKKTAEKKEPGPKDAKGSVKGAVAFEGDAPKQKKIDVAADKYCTKSHESEPLLTEDQAIVKDGKLKNVIVYVSKGLEKYSYDAPAEAAKIDQKGCHYVPHVLGMMVGQSLEVTNSDETMHNIHGTGADNPGFNKGQASAGLKDVIKGFDSPELPYNVGCDVHKWMNAKIGVFDHPFFAVTGDDGAFELKGLPDGDYELEAWHETLGKQSAKVTIKDGGAAEAKFSFKK